MGTELIAGAFGGVVRGLVGYTKYQFAYKNIQFNWVYFLIIVGLSAVVGVTVTWAVKNSGLVIGGVEVINPALAFIIGYAGGDFIENIYKLLTQKPFLGPVGDVIKKLQEAKQ